MVLRDGNKYACESCIRGHRVTGCNHTDRELHFIAPKGRPVKQCEHCRGARKSKSHHGKCDCGGKRDRNEIRLDDKECCCTLGDSCTCGTKKDEVSRLDSGPPRALHSRPHPTKNVSDGHLTTFINSKHKACHKWDASQSHAPYPRPKLNAASCHSSSPNVTGQLNRGTLIPGTPQGFTQDDWHVPMATSNPNPGLTSPSLDSLPLSFFGSDILNGNGALGSLPQYLLSGTTPQVEDSELYTIPSNDSVSASFLQEIMAANAANAANPRLPNQRPSLQSSTSLYGVSQEDSFNAEKASFGSSDLPLNNGTHLMPEFPQTTSFTDESAALSAPGLTATSSTAPSELDDALMIPEGPANSIFDTDGFPMDFNATNVDSTDADTAQALYSMASAPVSSSSPQAPRRSLDAQALKSLSTFPAFDTNVTDYFAVPDFDRLACIDNAESAVTSAARVSGPDVKPNLRGAAAATFAGSFASELTRPTSLASPYFPEQARARSVTIPASHHYPAYDPMTTSDQAYSQLAPDLSAAADWESSGGFGSWEGLPVFLPRGQ